MTEYENDGNTYCHGIVNCKYFDDGECLFMDMGSGNPDDMPCLVQAKIDIKAFHEWREQKEERPQGEITEEDIQNAIKAGYENGYSMAQAKYQRPQGEWKITEAYPHKVYCDKCYKTYAQENWEVWKDGSLPRNFCPNCGALMMKGDKE